MGDSEFVSESQCRERREACKELRTADSENRDGWIKSIDTKLNLLIFFILGQLCALIYVLIQLKK